MLDTDIEGLGPKEASAYVLAFITTLKQTEKALAAAAEEVALWARRATLARSKGEAELAAQAEIRLSEAEGKETKLKAELAELSSKVSVLKEKLMRVRMTGARLVDADLLLAQLEMVVGKQDDLSRTMKSMEAGAALEDLKKKMRG